ncbi:MAG TPA: hypothetical protein VFP91_10300 [Vicinamibacterales bacterium]|nr:hypothetical protein [Vicinamibacterales bacterium]
MPQTLNVLAPIRAGEEARLQQVLRAIGDDIKGRTLSAASSRPHIDFTRSRHIHFARFAILDDPDRGPTRKRLFYASAYDGGLDAHLAELVGITSDMDAIWGHCDAYPGEARFGEFIRAHAHEADALYIAFRDATVERIQQSIAKRREAELSRDPEAVQPRRVSAIERLIRAFPIVVDVSRAIVRCGFVNVFRGTQRIIASLDRYAVFRWSNWITHNHLSPMVSAYSSVDLDNCGRRSGANGMPPTFREDVVTQNQLTVITVVRDGHVDRVRAVLSAIDSYAKRLSPDGSLIGISTIHFVRWLVIDEGRRLMLVSDYDGSWESYIDEFAEMILSGLEAIWETAEGFPPGGARDLPAFKQFLRGGQVPSEVFFSAYPEETVLNIINDVALLR